MDWQGGNEDEELRLALLLSAQEAQSSGPTKMDDEEDDVRRAKELSVEQERLDALNREREEQELLQAIALSLSDSPLPPPPQDSRDALKNSMERLGSKIVRELIVCPLALAGLVIGSSPSELWVGNLPPNVTEAKLHKLFARFGAIKSVHLKPNTKDGLGTAFVNFVSPADAASSAKAALHGTKALGGVLSCNVKKETTALRLRNLEGKHSVRIYVNKGAKATTFTVEGQVVNVGAAADAIRQIIEEAEAKIPRNRKPPTPSATANGSVHVFIDNSNIFIGVQTAQGNEKNFNLRVNVEKFVELVEGGRNVETRVVAGSKPPSNSQVWTRYAALQYQVRLGLREKVGDKWKEVFVDEALHSAMGLLLQRKATQKGFSPGKHTVVLCTGDGNDNDGNNSFYSIIEALLASGFRCEIWSWKKSLRSNYWTLYKRYSALCKIRLLDPYFKVLAWEEKVKPGAFMNNNNNNNNDNYKIGKTDDSTDDDEDVECIVCLEYPREVTFRPCNHKVCCKVCSEKMKDTCPYCRTPISQKQ